MKIAVYPGSFDPVTYGHVDIVERAASIFGKVYVAVIKNPDKKENFDFKTRQKMIKGAVKYLKNVVVEIFDGLLVDYAKKKNASAIIRGLRAVSDFEYEFQMALTNRKMCPDIETIFFMTDYKYAYLSSSMVRQISKLGGSVSGMVPHNVEKELKGG
ncbi:MAG: pantetheine-phosphate adenylyltransferase [Candidatus Saganbacteria bacterium]|uniref:Phosphopantetheine adenylyltransferase n=1 Tax=Candidatus Saganbacteria bacterium TaxID=2575572 RepID=A0A833L2I7_UNCSA|nr:MAG: pantetheine-phosphate adenylyltransferase [Candidatus Saganbacteria bacterium]